MVLTGQYYSGSGRDETNHSGNHHTAGHRRGRRLDAVVARLTQFGTVVESRSVILSLVVSASVGIFFGYYPARRAARLDPIDALRYE